MERTKTLSLFRVLLLLLVISSFVGCHDLDNDLKSAALDVDATTNKLTGTASQMQGEIDKLSKEIPDDVKKLIDNDLNDVIQTSIDATSNNFKCDVEFVRTRLTKSLGNLKVAILSHLKKNKDKKMEAIAISPMICNCMPLVIDQDKPRINKIIFSGYDFPKSGMKIYAKRDNGDSVDLSRHLAQPTQFNITFAADMDTLQYYDRLSLQYPGLEGNREILILPKQPIPCNQEARNITATPAGYSFVAQNHPCCSDNEFKGHGPVINFTGDLRISDDKKSILCKIHFSAAETQKDNSTVYHDAEFSIYKSDPKTQIAEILTPTHFEYNYTDDNEEDDQFGANGFVSMAVIRGDHQGDDIGTYTGATINFSNMRVTLIDCCNGCVNKAELDSFIANNNLKYADFVKLDSISRLKPNKR